MQAHPSAAPTEPAERSLTLTARLGERWVDLRNLWLIAAGMVAVLLLLPPEHDFPVIDDWIYARSVQHQVATGAFVMPPQSQANLVGLTLWGTAWVRLFGFSFTILTVSTLVLAFVCLAVFYLLARTVGVTPAGALLGTALVGFNPLFLHLSYSFMTDVPFLALMLVACLCYTLGLQGRGDAWLWAGGLVAGYSFLIRQFGVIPPAAFAAYLLLDGLITRRWRWLQIVQIVALPVLFAAGWYVYSRDFPVNGAQQTANRLASEFVGKPNWPGVFLNRCLTILPLTALFAWCAVRLNRRRLVFSAVWAAVMLWATFTIALPQESYTFVGYGNIIRVGGLDFFEYKQQPIWTPEVWKALAVLGALLTGVLLGHITDARIDWLTRLRKREPLSPVVGFYLAGAAIFAVSIGLLGYLFDRYALSFLPFVALFAVREAGKWGRAAWTYSIAALVLVAGFSLVAQADFVDHDRARWTAGEWLRERAPLTIHVGYDWDNWTVYPSGQYEVTDLHIEGWRTEREFPYLSRLSGWTTRYVLAESAPTAPALRVVGGNKP